MKQEREREGEREIECLSLCVITIYTVEIFVQASEPNDKSTTRIIWIWSHDSFQERKFNSLTMGYFSPSGFYRYRTLGRNLKTFREICRNSNNMSIVSWWKEGSEHKEATSKSRSEVLDAGQLLKVLPDWLVRFAETRAEPIYFPTNYRITFRKFRHEEY